MTKVNSASTLLAFSSDSASCTPVFVEIFIFCADEDNGCTSGKNMSTWKNAQIIMYFKMFDKAEMYPEKRLENSLRTV